MHSYTCICAEWRRSINGPTQLRPDNRGINNTTELMFNNIMSNAKGEYMHQISSNKINREAEYLSNRDGKSKLSLNRSMKYS